MSPSTSNAAIKTASLSQSQVLRLLVKLEGLLPYTIPLTRRIQFHLKKPKETSEIILSIAIPSDSIAGGVSEEIDVHDRVGSWLETPTTVESTGTELPWIASHVDLSSPGTTQAWVFGSWEILSTSPLSQNKLHAELLHSLLHHIHTTLVPTMPLDPPATWLKLRDTGKWLSQPYSRSKVLFGTLHEGVRALMQDHWVARIDARYEKWGFGPSVLENRNSTHPDTINGNFGQGLPEGYAVGTLEEDELQTILDGTPIPRTLAYLKEVVNAGIYHRPTPNAHTRNETNPNTLSTNDIKAAKSDVIPKNDKGKADLIAYAFLGKDGSLGGLDVSPAHRGKGVAVHLASELFRREAVSFKYTHIIDAKDNGLGMEAGIGGEALGREERAGWYHHADVGEDNTASQAVMRKLGGKRMWRVCWVEVDVEVAMGIKERARAEVGEGRLDGEVGEIRGKGR